MTRFGVFKILGVGRCFHQTYLDFVLVYAKKMHIRMCFCFFTSLPITLSSTISYTNRTREDGFSKAIREYRFTKLWNVL